jgi:hypothetical protein
MMRKMTIRKCTTCKASGENCPNCTSPDLPFWTDGSNMFDEARIDQISQNGNDGLHYDAVNHPPHYTQGGIECINAIKAALTPEEWRGYCKGNALKYVWRERHKGGDESLQKAAWYLARMA